MKTSTRGRGLMLAAITAGLAAAPLHAAFGRDGRAGNTRTGTDNTTATGADTGRRAAAAPPADQTPAETTAVDQAWVLAKLHMLNQMEIEASRLATQKGDAEGVRSHGARLEREHRAAGQKILSYAKEQGVDLAAQKAVVQSDTDYIDMRDTMHGLIGLRGTEFDRVLVQAMERGHRKIIDFVTSAGADATDPQLKGLLSDLLSPGPSSSEGRRPADNTRR